MTPGIVDTVTRPCEGTAMISPADLMTAMPFAQHIGVVIETALAEEVTGTLAWAPERCTSAGVMHGGALMTLADTIGAACAFLNLPEGATTTTVESSSRFFRGVRGGEVRAMARPLHAGRTMIVVQTDLYDADGRRLAQTTQTQAVLSG
jgi:1,4-dihydroxy-2-naphthoyl-CoA hydrolase